MLAAPKNLSDGLMRAASVRPYGENSHGRKNRHAHGYIANLIQLKNSGMHQLS